MKYKLEMYGWEVESTGHSITDEQVKSIEDLIGKKGKNQKSMPLHCHHLNAFS